MNIYAIGGMHKNAAGKAANFAGVSCRACRNLVYCFRCPPGNREEVRHMNILTSFLVSLAAGIACYYICKWLDRHGRGS